MCNGENARLRPGLRERVPPRLSERGSGEKLATHDYYIYSYTTTSYCNIYSCASTYTAKEVHEGTIQLHAQTVQLCETSVHLHIDVYNHV